MIRKAIKSPNQRGQGDLVQDQQNPEKNDFLRIFILKNPKSKFIFVG